ncbi:hypothetical protein AVEN_47449-1 [Araneus ventricosus]|uniref:Retrovirus-related Pol polyprotein from transposon TNT 1-94 n=1 Tax=Araneus ventricosus TaxID=182803 RepID=A0A4Y2IQE9_ARAVE|nr:hypothetical protein AVEN_47449-1 [Araneus ventricosus]
MIAYTPNGCRLWDIKRKIVLSRNVSFDEESFISEEALRPKLNQQVLENSNDEEIQSPDSEEVAESIAPELRKNKRTKKVSSWFNDYNIAHLVLNAEKYMEEAKSRPDYKYWMKTVDDEMASLQKN